MSYPAVFSEVASAVKEVGGTVNSVINVIAWSVLKIFPVLVAMLIGLIAIDIVLGPLFDDDVASETPFLSQDNRNDLQLSANQQLDIATVTDGSLADARP